MSAHIEIRPIPNEPELVAEISVTPAGSLAMELMLFSRDGELSGLVWSEAAKTYVHIRGYDAEKVAEKIIGPIFPKRVQLEEAA